MPLPAARLADRGAAVDVFERRPDPRDGEPYEGRSINLALSTRGLDALDRIGVGDQLRAAGVPVRGRMIHHADGTTSFQPYSTNPAHHLWSVNRDRLNLVVLEAAAARPGVSVHFEHRLTEVDLPDRPDQPVELKTDEQKLSYAMGRDLGEYFKGLEENLDLNVLKQAISEGRFKVNAEKVADSLIESVRQMLGSQVSKA